MRELWALMEMHLLTVNSIGKQRKRGSVCGEVGADEQGGKEGVKERKSQ